MSGYYRTGKRYEFKLISLAEPVRRRWRLGLLRCGRAYKIRGSPGEGAILPSGLQLVFSRGIAVR